MIRILLADDHALVRRGVRLILEQQPDIEVVAEAADGAEVLTLLRDIEVDLVILDIAMPIMTGLQAAREINRRRHSPRILMLSMHDNEQYFFEALRLGASGYVLKSVVDEDLVEACRAAMRDEPFVYPGAMGALVRDYLDRLARGERVPETVLTPREDEVQVVTRHAAGFDPRDLAAAGVRPVATPEDLAAGTAAVGRVQVSPEVVGYVVDLARATRTSPSLQLGVSPRGATALMRTARAWAWLAGRDYVTPDDVKALAHATLAHRVALRPEAELEGVTTTSVLETVLASVPVPR